MTTNVTGTAPTIIDQITDLAETAMRLSEAAEAGATSPLQRQVAYRLSLAASQFRGAVDDLADAS